MAAPPSPARATPLSDLEVAAKYAGLEFESVTAQLAVAAPAVAGGAASAAADGNDDDSEDESENEPMAGDGASSGDESSSDEDGADSKYSTAKLRAEIEAAMESEDAQAGGPLKTTNEITSLPVREPAVELTAATPVAECGSILSRSEPGLMVTIKSLANAKPLDEGSVLCLADRTVLGCVDEVFGPVLMPMYLVRFESADKMPAAATVGARVFFATEHTTYIVPEQIKDKGTDASNLYDEETDEAVYSDDEAEAAAKRQHRKRNRGGAPTSAAPSRPSGQQQPAQGRSSYTQGRGPRAPAGSVADYTPGTQSFAYSGGVAFQVQPFGGQTKYTTGPVAFGQPPRATPMAYGPTKYTSPGGYVPPPPPASAQAAPYAQTPMYHQPPLPHGMPSAPAYQAPLAYPAPFAPPPPPQAPYTAPRHFHQPPQTTPPYSQPMNPAPYQQGTPAPPAPPQGGYHPTNPSQPPLPRGGYQDRRY